MSQNGKKYTCYDCKWYDDSDIPDTCGCGECIRFPPTAIKRCEQPYTMGKYPVISEYNKPCGEFYFIPHKTFEETLLESGLTLSEFQKREDERYQKGGANERTYN